MTFPGHTPCERCFAGTLGCVGISIAVMVAPAWAQTDPSNFDTVINVPGDFSTIRDGIGSNTQLNLFDDGTIYNDFQFGSPDGTSVNIEGNLYDGTLGKNAAVYSGTTLNLLGVRISSRLRATGNSTVNYFGGGFASYSSSDVIFEFGSVFNMFGGSFNTGVTFRAGAVANMYGGRLTSSIGVTNGGTFNFFDGELNSGVGVIDSSFSMSGGYFPGSLGTVGDATVSISGGLLGGGISLNSGTTSIHGGEFRFNGQPVNQLPPSQNGDVFTCTLTDGSVLLLRKDDNGTSYYSDTFDPSSVSLVPAEIPPADLTPMILESGPAPAGGLRPGQSLTLRGDATLHRDFFCASSTLLIEGGLAHSGMEISETELTITGGEVYSFLALAGSRVSVDGGVTYGFTAGRGGVIDVVNTDGHGHMRAEDQGLLVVHYANSIYGVVSRSNATAEVFGGFFEGQLFAYNQGTMNIYGGEFLRDAVVYTEGQLTLLGGIIRGGLSVSNANSTATILGGSFGNDLALSGGTTTLHGGEFQLNSSTITEFPGPLNPGDIFTGVLESGHVFIVAEFTGDSVAEGTLQLVTIPIDPADTTPIVVSTGEGPPEGLRPGQTLTLAGDATLPPEYAVVGATLNIDGGTVGSGIEAIDSAITVNAGSVGGNITLLKNSDLFVHGGGVGVVEGNITLVENARLFMHGGSVGPNLTLLGSSRLIMHDGEHAGGIKVFDDSIAIIHDGTIGETVEAHTGTTLRIHGGSFAGSVTSWRNSVVEVTGGDLGENFRVAYDGHATISGGTIGPGFRLDPTGTLEYRAASFEIDGVPIDNLSLGVPRLIAQRGVTLSGRFADGSAFSVELDDVSIQDQNYFSSDADLLVTLVAPLCQADVLTDGVIDTGDIGVFVNLFLAEDPIADFNGDGVIDLGDIQSFIAQFLAGC